MADENVTIKIDTKADTRAIDRVRRKLAALSAQQSVLGQRIKDTAGNYKLLNMATRSMDLNNAATRKAEKGLKKFSILGGKTANIFGTIYKFAMIGSALETAGLALALSSVNGFLITGRVLARGWSATINGLGVAAANATAAVGVLVAVFTAAMRQYSAAQASFAYGGDFTASSSALRQMQTDSQLAVFGLQSVTAAFAAASRNTKVTSTTVKAIGGLSDFAVASGDMEKGLNAAAEIVSLLESGKSAGDLKVLDAAMQLGPVFEDAYKKATASGTKSSQEILKMFSTGELASAAGIAGTADNVRRSLMGQLKAFATEIQTTFADMGANFIEPIQKAFEQIRRTVFKMTVEISGSLNRFAQGPFTNFLTKSMDVMAGWIAKLVNVWLPKSEEVFNNFINGWNKMTSSTRRFFQRFELFLKKYSEASKIVNTFFGLIFKRGFGDAIGRNFKSFSDLIVENQDNFLDYGEAIGELVSSILNLFGVLRESFIKALPAINAIVDALSSLVDVMSKLVGFMQVFGRFGGLAGFLLPMAFVGSGRTAAGRRRPGSLKVGPKAAIAGGIAAAGTLSSLPGGNELMAAGATAYGGYKLGGAAASRAGMTGTAKMGVAAKTSAIVAAPVIAALITNTVTRKVEEHFGNTLGTVSIGAGVGAGTGAAAGATIGSIVFPGAGTAIGAAAGAVIGTVIGIGLGFVQSHKFKKQAEEAGGALAGFYSDGVIEMMQLGGFEEAQKMMDDFGDVAKEFSEKIPRNQEFLAGALKEFEEAQRTILQPAMDQYNRNVEDLSAATGKSAKEIAELAMSVGLDLTSNIVNINDMLAEMGLTVRRVGEEFDAAFANIIGRAASEMRQHLDVLNAPKIMTEAAENFRQLLVSDTQTDDDVVHFLETLVLQSQTMFAGDSLGAFEYVLANIGATGSQFEAGGVFEGFDMSVFGDFLKNFTASSEAGLRDIVAENIIATLSAQGETLGMAPAAIATAIEDANLTEKELIELGRRSQEADFLKDSASELLEIFGKEMETQETAEAKFGLAVDKYGELTDSFIEGVGTLKNDEKVFADAVEDFADAIGRFDVRTGGIIPQRPANDTTSPRRNLVNTMSQHGRFDMGIAGSRTITSAFRTNNLGSMSSDHAAGKAYDLTGNNLGLYKTSVLNAGGYADFHGAGGSRHLHVVPPEGPVGDRTTPYMGSSVPSGGSNEFNYNITVNASEGMDEMALANLVVEKIERKQRMMSERR